MTWCVDESLSIGYKTRPVATVTEKIRFEAGTGHSSAWVEWPGENDFDEDPGRVASTFSRDSDPQPGALFVR